MAPPSLSDAARNGGNRLFPAAANQLQTKDDTDQNQPDGIDQFLGRLADPFLVKLGQVIADLNPDLDRKSVV